jgi:hypothetical protein
MQGGSRKAGIPVDEKTFQPLVKTKTPSENAVEGHVAHLVSFPIINVVEVRHQNWTNPLGHDEH